MVPSSTRTYHHETTHTFPRTHPCKNGILIDRAILDTALALPDDLLMLLEAAVEKIHLSMSVGPSLS
jgi:hypothetical protein